MKFYVPKKLFDMIKEVVFPNFSVCGQIIIQALFEAFSLDEESTKNINFVTLDPG
jgi:hypothetical protein